MATLGPLHNAVQRGDLPTVVRLLEQGEDINVTDNVSSMILLYK
jgi:hypothetical protein